MSARKLFACDICHTACDTRASATESFRGLMTVEGEGPLDSNIYHLARSNPPKLKTQIFKIEDKINPNLKTQTIKNKPSPQQIKNPDIKNLDTVTDAIMTALRPVRRPTPRTAPALIWVTLTGAPSQTLLTELTQMAQRGGWCVVSSRPDGTHEHVHALIVAESYTAARDDVDAMAERLGISPLGQNVKPVSGWRMADESTLARSIYHMAAYALRVAHHRIGRAREVPRSVDAWGALAGIDTLCDWALSGVTSPPMPAPRDTCACGCGAPCAPGSRYASDTTGAHRQRARRQRLRAQRRHAVTHPPRCDTRQIAEVMAAVTLAPMPVGVTSTAAIRAHVAHEMMTEPDPMRLRAAVVARAWTLPMLSRLRDLADIGRNQKRAA